MFSSPMTCAYASHQVYVAAAADGSGHGHRAIGHSSFGIWRSPVRITALLGCTKMPRTASINF